MYWRVSTAPGVSIPHRYAKNAIYNRALSPEEVVSIPHRYAKNRAHFCDGLTDRLFQFLIGTLKTIPP